MHQASVLSNDLVMLLQHTTSAYTYVDTEHFHLSLSLFYQQVATEEPSSSKWALPYTLPKIENMSVQRSYGKQSD